MLQRNLIACTTLIVTLTFCSTALTQEKERKNIDQLTADELANYTHAVKLLMDSMDDKKNYQFHADLHNLFLDDPPYGCEHASELFFPGHRYHLRNFEKALQDADPGNPKTPTKDVMIPYWDWSNPASGKRYPKAFEDTTSVLFKPRNNGNNTPLLNADSLTVLVRDTPDWNKFAGNPKNMGGSYGVLESPAHNDMHSIYIGNMLWIKLCSARRRNTVHTVGSDGDETQEQHPGHGIFVSPVQLTRAIER